MDNKKEQTELKATNIISLFHPFFFVNKAGRHFGFLKKAGRHQKGAGRRALQKRPRQNTGSRLFQVYCTCLFSLSNIVVIVASIQASNYKYVLLLYL